MPVYQFKRLSADGRADTRALELEDASQARAVALRYFAGEVTGLVRHDPECDDLRVQVTEGSRRPLFTIQLTVVEGAG